MARDPKTRSAFMTASTDLLHQPQAAHHSPHASPRWGTWEELLLASAIKRYGQENWALVSVELQSRIAGGLTFTPEACQAKYEAIKLRFGFPGASEKSDDTCWFEELRRLRVAQLKRELEQYDSSIGSLEEKIRNLQSERGKGNSQNSLSVEKGAAESKGERYDACKPGSGPDEAESGVSGCCENAASIDIKEDDKAKTLLQTRTLLNAQDDDDDEEDAVKSKARLALNKEDRAFGYVKCHMEFGMRLDATECSLSSTSDALKPRLGPSLERGDSTNRKPQQATVTQSVNQDHSANKDKMDAKNLLLELSNSKVKAEILTAEEAVPEIWVYKMSGGMQTLASKELAVTNPQAEKLDAKEHGADLPCEVWGESLEMLRMHKESASKRENFSAEGRIQKLAVSLIKDSELKGDSLVPLTPAELCAKAESVSTNNEGSVSAQASGSPGENVDSMEAWHHLERLSGDSRVEKSESSSAIDLSEDISPMSNTNKREPKVCGKLIPLLISLRNIGAHRCAPQFRHQRESQSNRRYHLLIRAPMDLGMIRSKLEEGQYHGSLDFFRDLLLMVTNALIYYSKDSSESAAASGLRECIMREMESIFKTEFLVKQEGPTVRKRESGKASQLSPIKRGKVAGTRTSMPSGVDKAPMEGALRGCDPILILEDKDAGAKVLCKGSLTIDDRQKSRMDGESVKPRSVASKIATVDARDPLVMEEQRTPTFTAGVSSGLKVPLKRGVGRPPKHFHDQDQWKSKETSMSPWKRPKM